MREDKVRVGVIALITDGKGRFLMERRTVEEEEEKSWSFIAGGKKSGENTLEAVMREVREEVDAEFIPEEIVGVVDHQNQRDDDNAWTVIGIKGSIAGEPVNAEPEKRDRVEWKDDIPDNLHPTTEMMLETYLSDSLHAELSKEPEESGIDA